MNTTEHPGLVRGSLLALIGAVLYFAVEYVSHKLQEPPPPQNPLVFVGAVDEQPASDRLPDDPPEAPAVGQPARVQLTLYSDAAVDALLTISTGPDQVRLVLRWAELRFSDRGRLVAGRADVACFESDKRLGETEVFAAAGGYKLRLDLGKEQTIYRIAQERGPAAPGSK